MIVDTGASTDIIDEEAFNSMSQHWIKLKARELMD